MTVWIENTTGNYDHGGPGWEFGVCVWSPALDRRGLEGRYKIMREVRAREKILNCYDGSIRGTAEIGTECYTTQNRPPEPGPWAYARSFHRFNLANFRRLPQPVPLKRLIENFANEIRRDIEENRPTYYLFSWYPPSPFKPNGKIVLSQGRFLARGTPALIDMLCRATGLDRSTFER